MLCSAELSMKKVLRPRVKAESLFTVTVCRGFVLCLCIVMQLLVQLLMQLLVQLLMQLLVQLLVHDLVCNHLPEEERAYCVAAELPLGLV